MKYYVSKCHDKLNGYDYNPETVTPYLCLNPLYNTRLINDNDWERGEGYYTIDEIPAERFNRLRRNQIGRRVWVDVNAPYSWLGVRVGDKVRVVKGRKYPKDLVITVSKTYVYYVDYGFKRDKIGYILGVNGEKIAIENCVMEEPVEVCEPQEP